MHTSRACGSSEYGKRGKGLGSYYMFKASVLNSGHFFNNFMLVNGLEEGAGPRGWCGGLVASYLAVRRKINVYLLYRNKQHQTYILCVKGLKGGWGVGGGIHQFFALICTCALRRQLFSTHCKNKPG
jgi:hypothetical protein